MLLAKQTFALLLACYWLHPSALQAQPVSAIPHHLQTPSLTSVHINDAFWSPRLKLWRTKTVYDVFDKLEGKYEPDRNDLIEEKQKKGSTRNAFLNFDRVAAGEKDTKNFDGLPWFDGLIYETIRGAADGMLQQPDTVLQHKIDAYIKRIAAAQAADPTGYLNTYTTLNKSNQRWGANGGDDKWQHDIYNAGMLFDAAVHYYEATHNTDLLTIAVKQANCICNEIGAAPKLNVIPGHGGPEEALLKLYQLFTTHPALKQQLPVKVDEQQYYDMVKYWIENRGHYGGNGYATRNSDGAYNQDHLPVFEHNTIEGHAVRATLLAAGVTAMALENNQQAYREAASRYWNNMIGKKLFITGGEGAIADQEKFGPDYFLPESAYLETCASIGAGFFSERMNELFADGRYIDELERVLYNNMLSGISLSGDHYFYENPLQATANHRWSWHSCPCCPPMFLKMVGALPRYIYAYDSNAVYVNLFISSNAVLPLHGDSLRIKQFDGVRLYRPGNQFTHIEINPAHADSFTVYVRIPGWAQGKENPWELYRSWTVGEYSIQVNGKHVEAEPHNGYIAINRTWKKGDKILLRLPAHPRWILANDSVSALKGKVALAVGPMVYALEQQDNHSLEGLRLLPTWPIEGHYNVATLNGVEVLKGKARNARNRKVNFKAIPFYAIGNRKKDDPYKVWMPMTK